MQTLIILGRQPALGLAELESLYGADVLNPLGNIAVAIDLPPVDINFARLGGMVKFAKILTVLDTTNWGDIQKFLENAVPGHAANLPEGKLRLGMSVYGLGITPNRIKVTGLTLKKIIRTSGRSVRYVPNVENELNAAQVLHNQLTQKLGWELLFIKDGHKTVVAQSIAVQDIDAYRRRDQERPMRDARVGMLPPKLAQIIVNLAVSQSDTRSGSVVLDPFCGTGVILQEATLMGFDVVGSDIDPRMVEYTDKNLMWLLDQPRCPVVRPPETNGDSEWRYFDLKIADATRHTWSPPPNFIASETYLGRALSSTPDTSTLQKIIQDCDTIHKKFLQNVAQQTKPGFRLAIAVPAWRVSNSFAHLPTLDKLDSLGYNRIKFVHVSDQDLIYHREGQIVARELVVLERK